MNTTQVNVDYIEDILDRSVFDIPSNCEEFIFPQK